MLVKDKFPYTDCGPLGPLDLEQGKRNLDKFVFVGLNEMYDTSMVLLGEALAIPLQPQVWGIPLHFPKNDPPPPPFSPVRALGLICRSFKDIFRICGGGVVCR